jgi:TatD DNase family protein
MIRNDRHRSMVSSLPLDRLLTETDGPFAKVDGRDAYPSDISRTIDELAQVRSLPTSELVEIVAANLKRLVSE